MLIKTNSDTSCKKYFGRYQRSQMCVFRVRSQTKPNRPVVSFFFISRLLQACIPLTSAPHLLVGMGFNLHNGVVHSPCSGKCVGIQRVLVSNLQNILQPIRSHLGHPARFLITQNLVWRPDKTTVPTPPVTNWLLLCNQSFSWKT